MTYNVFGGTLNFNPVLEVGVRLGLGTISGHVLPPSVVII